MSVVYCYLKELNLTVLTIFLFKHIAFGFLQDYCSAPVVGADWDEVDLGGFWEMVTFWLESVAVSKPVDDVFDTIFTEPFV